MNHILLISIFFSTTVFADFEYKKTYKAEDMARRFFGPGTEKELEKQAIDLGSVSLDVRTEINCGNIDLVASAQSQFKQIDDTLKAFFNSLKDTPLTSLALLALCTDQAELCTYVRDLNANFFKKLKMDFDACQAIDSYLYSRAEEGARTIKANKIAECIQEKSHGGKYTKEIIDTCKSDVSKESKSRNLLKPFSDTLADGEQNVLKSILIASKSSDHYELLSPILGEVRLYQNGYWSRAFPNGQLSANDVTTNFLAKGQSKICNTADLRTFIKSGDLNGLKGMDLYIAKSIKRKITPEVLKDLESLPDYSREIVCQRLGDAIAAISLKEFESETKSIMVASLKNNALPDPIRVFYQNDIGPTFDSIRRKIESREIPSLEESIKKLSMLGSDYRRRAQENASRASKAKIQNKKSEKEMECIDTLTCSKL